MKREQVSRRGFIRSAGKAAGALAACSLGGSGTMARAAEVETRRGSQRLSLERLKQFETLRYGMFISYDIQAFVRSTLHGKTLTEEQLRIPASVYAPDKLDVEQWISVARDAGMKYAVLTTKRIPGFCLWPSKHTGFTVANSGNKTDVVEKYVKACDKCGVQPGLYYCSFDFHHMGDRTAKPLSSARNQTFIINQLTELLTNYGPIAVVWIDSPGGFSYEHIARLQPNTVIVMNAGFHDGTKVRTWPTDVVTLEKTLPPEGGYSPWKTVKGKEYYMPGEFCDSIKPSWWWVEGQEPRPDEKVLAQFQACRAAGINFLLDAPPDNHGLVPQSTIDALLRLRRNAGI